MQHHTLEFQHVQQEFQHVQQEFQQFNIANTSALQPDGLAKAKEERGMSSAMKMYLQVQR